MFVVWYTSSATTAPSLALRSSSPPPAPYADVRFGFGEASTDPYHLFILLKDVRAILKER